MVDNILFSKFVLNQLNHDEMIAVEKELMTGGEANSVLSATIANYELNEELADKMLGTEEINKEKLSSPAINVESSSSKVVETSKNTTIMKNNNFPFANSEAMEPLTNDFRNSENKDLSLDENLVNFYMAHVAGASKEEAKDCVAKMRSGITSFTDRLSKALSGDLDTVLGDLDTLGEGLDMHDRYEMLLNVLAMLNALNIKNLDEEEMMDKETYDAIRQGLLKTNDAVTDYDIQSLIDRIKDEIKNHSHVASSVVNIKKILSDMSPDTKLATYTNGDQMRQMLIMSMISYVGIKNEGSDAENISPEMVAVCVAEQYQNMATIEKIEKGEITEEEGFETLKIIAFVALLTLVLCVVGLLIATGMYALLIGLLVMFGENCGFIIWSVIAGAMIIDADNIGEFFEGVLERTLTIIDKAIDYCNDKIIPYAKEVAHDTWNFVKEKYNAVKDWIILHLS